MEQAPHVPYYQEVDLRQNQSSGDDLGTSVYSYCPDVDTSTGNAGSGTHYVNEAEATNTNSTPTTTSATTTTPSLSSNVSSSQLPEENELTDSQFSVFYHKNKKNSRKGKQLGQKLE
eukprot:TRINITY_DN5762_c0_g1_i1.p1 TRINITY_DN5762_c0_g1~~TRINITY_DN5762_c0_g1_i1.p1  ORF type:complete len:117 (-),score=34.64 TRINITY_DN5762_c0_g1_i1:188-538(-)